MSEKEALGRLVTHHVNEGTSGSSVLENELDSNFDTLSIECNTDKSESTVPNLVNDSVLGGECGMKNAAFEIVVSQLRKFKIVPVFLLP
jgi:hypothetical protein